MDAGRLVSGERLARAELLTLQRSVGNRALRQLLRAPETANGGSSGMPPAQMSDHESAIHGLDDRDAVWDLIERYQTMDLAKLKEAAQTSTLAQMVLDKRAHETVAKGRRLTAVQQMQADALNDPDAWFKLIDHYEGLSKGQLKYRALKDELAKMILQERTDEEWRQKTAGDAQAAIEDDYRPPHRATGYTFDQKGKLTRAFSTWSGGQTEEQKKSPKGRQEVHTERKLMATAEDEGVLVPGGRLVIFGQYDPCRFCRAAMRAMAISKRCRIVYWWPGAVHDPKAGPEGYVFGPHGQEAAPAGEPGATDQERPTEDELAAGEEPTPAAGRSGPAGASRGFKAALGKALLRGLTPAEFTGRLKVSIKPTAKAIGGNLVIFLIQTALMSALAKWTDAMNERFIESKIEDLRPSVEDALLSKAGEAEALLKQNPGADVYANARFRVVIGYTNALEAGEVENWPLVFLDSVGFSHEPSDPQPIEEQRYVNAAFRDATSITTSSWPISASELQTGGATSGSEAGSGSTPKPTPH